MSDLREKKTRDEKKNTKNWAKVRYPPKRAIDVIK